MIRLYDTLKFGYLINKTVDLSGKTMSLDTAKDVLRHLGTNGTGQTISFSNDTWGLICGDDEAIELLEAGYANGWSSNEPDIQIVANNGYNGQVYVNRANKTLTNISGTEVWIGSAGTVTSLYYFLKHDSRANYNSTSVNIKKVRFGKNINTASCTDLQHAFATYTTTSIINSIDVRHLNTANVTNMEAGFSAGGGNVKLIGIENFDVAKVTTFAFCFNAIYKNEIFDLRNWHTLSNATVTGIFSTLSDCANSASNPVIYYTPGYWKADLPATDRLQLTVYPYHDITVASSLTSGQKIYINGTTADMTYDSSLGIWYYDINGTVSTMASMFRQNSSYNPTANSVISMSFGPNISSKINYASVNNSFLFAWKPDANNMRTVDFTSLAKALNDNLNFVPIRQMFIYSAVETSHGANLVNVYGLDKITKQIYVDHAFRGCESLRYIDLGTTDYALNGFGKSFYYNTNLIRIKNLPGMPEGCNTTDTFTGCTSLTTIDAAGPIAESIDFSPCPLNLASAKVILSALQTVTSETISFSDTTWGYIAADDEAIDLLEAAYAKGWSSNEPDITIIANSGYNGVVRVNAADKQLTQVGSTGVWIGSAGTVTSLAYFLKHDSRNNYNSTSTNIKKVRFGKNINTASCTAMNHMCNCNGSSATNLATIDVSHINSSNVTTMYATFGDINSAGTTKILGLTNLDVAKVTNFAYCFNSVQIKDTLDLHTWHTNANATNMTGFTRGLASLANVGVNYPIYYTPGYWKAPLPTSDSCQLTVYPYHDITVAASSGFNGTCTINETSVNMTQDSTLGIWYYDIPSGNSATSFNDLLRSSTSLLSVSFSSSLYSKLPSEGIGLYRAFNGCTSLKSIDLSMINDRVGSINSAFWGGNALSNITGIENANYGTLYHSFQNCNTIRYINIPSRNITSGNFDSAFYGCTNLIRLSGFPGMGSSVSTTGNMLYNCTALTTIDSSGDQYKTIDFSYCPLTLASAKVILNALQTVTAETLTFSSTTKGYINADSEALALVAAARNKGWTIAL